MTSSILDNTITPDQFSTDLDKPALISLSHLVCYQVSGDDATDFLQGQFSNDINSVTTLKGQITSYCTPKGRMLAIFYICKREDTYYLVTSKDIAEEVMKRLQMYVMRSKVTIKPMDDAILLGVCSDERNTILNTLDITMPDEHYQLSTDDTTLCINIPGVSTRHLIIGDQSLVKKLGQLSDSDINIFSNAYWQWLDILAGLPNITSKVQEAFVPQMTNMELIEGVSFSKGCYPGQEVVARLHYLGSASRRMFRVEGEYNEPVNIGDDIFTQGTDQPIGKFVSVINETDNKYSGLAALRLEAVKKNQLAIESASGNSVCIKPLPYDVPTELKEKEK